MMLPDEDWCRTEVVGRQLAVGIGCCPVSGMRQLAGTMLAVGTTFLVLGSWFLVLGSWFLVLGSWFLVLGAWERGTNYIGGFVRQSTGFG